MIQPYSRGGHVVVLRDGGLPVPSAGTLSVGPRAPQSAREVDVSRTRDRRERPRAVDARLARRSDVRALAARLLGAGAIGGAVLGVPATLRAQAEDPPRPVVFGVAGAAVMPAGSLADVSRPGVAVTALARSSVRLLPPRVAYRAEIGYAALGGKRAAAPTGPAVEAPDTRVLSALLSLELTNRRGLAARRYRPYALVGAGLYRFTRDGEAGTASATDFGVNAGIGLAFPLGGYAFFVEARYHNLFDDERTRYVAPVSLGITF